MKILSMTGFGESSGQLGSESSNQVNYRVTCKSVNHRFLDLSLKLPQKFSSLEFNLQKIIRSMVSRGRLEVSVNREVISQQSELSINKEMLESALKSISEVSVEGLSKDEFLKSALSALFSRKEILDISGSDIEIEKEGELIEKLIREAILKLLEAREFEGSQLKIEVDKIVCAIQNHVNEIDKLSKVAPKIIKDRFEERLSQLYANFKSDEPRMIQEISILADKVDIREEIVRLKSHVEHFASAVSDGGRKLEFIVQEMGREINTIGSKTTQIEVSSVVIEVKSLLEKLREQLQNIE